MEIKKVKETRIEETPHKLDVRKLYDKDSAQAIHITLQPGEALKPHITPVDVFFYVLEGSPEILIGKEKIQVEADNLVESPRDIVHCLYNNSNNIARILVVKAPRPTSSSKLL
ncbi:cupin domain-containing protein [Draconibacterium orientale]|jgi:quercetin dioxygenase-like cupin family protein|uniref:cupin domain-containing protein n=1 Tax=Draconibacterium orientale TaxID=1168034 RepID=UPI0029C05755|nr:cupin domain-containing protein [Draconibacterium orientale]HRX21759.1 cupin domain-containing protein [Syntrophomonadaceae bacterium]